MDPLKMQYHVLTTERCNLNCRYCGGTRHLPGIPLDIEYDMEDLVDFIEKDPEAVIGFYGGEPLLAMERMEEIMDRVPAKAFTLQTNGTLLNEVRTSYLRKFHSILVSIDGGKEITDRNRGEGIYDRIMENVGDIRDRGFKGDLIARMAYSDGGDIHRDVSHLLGIFDHVHWQLDVFWTELDTRIDPDKWIDDYDAGIERLIEDMRRGIEIGRIPGIVPFIPIMRTLLTREPHHIWCGSGVDSFSIMTSGSIETCPIAPELKYSNVGSLRTSTPESLRSSCLIGPPCTECDILWVCGGRCLFANKTDGWGRKWFDRICLSTRRMIEGLERITPMLKESIDGGRIHPEDLDYPDINNGCEIIP